MINKKVILNEDIVKDLSNNAVQNENEEFIFGYDKIFWMRGIFERTRNEKEV